MCVKGGKVRREDRASGVRVCTCACVCVCAHGWVSQQGGRTAGWPGGAAQAASLLIALPSEADCFSKVVNRQASLVRYHSNRGTVKVEK